MKIVLQCAIVLFVTATLYGQVTVKEPIPQTAVIDVNAAAVGKQEIPRTIFGTFLEPDGNSTYNGLWAGLLQNPSLEAGLWTPGRTVAMLHDNPELRRAGDLGLPLPWEPLDVRQGNRYEVHYGDAANSWQSLQVFGVPGEPTGIKQRVYLPIHRTCDYTGSFYAKHLCGDSSVTIALRVDGVGPRDKRKNSLNHAWGLPEYNSFGADEFLEFCRMIGAQPQIALNLGSGTPEEAAAWVRYVNDHWSTHPGLLRELGNELWNHGNLGYPTRDQLAARTADFSKSIQAVDPTARLLSKLEPLDRQALSATLQIDLLLRG